MARTTRTLTPKERALLAHLLTIQVEGIEELRAQASLARVIEPPEVPSNIELFVPSTAPRARSTIAHVPSSAVSKTLDEDAVDVTLWVDDGYLARIEIAPLGVGPLHVPAVNDLSEPREL